MRLRDTQAAKITLDVLRMSQWFFLAAALYFVTFDKSIGLQDANPGLQSTLYGLAQITIRAWSGYWIGRGLLGRLPPDFPLNLDNIKIAQAIVLGCCAVGRALVVGLVITTKL